MKYPIIYFIIIFSSCNGTIKSELLSPNDSIVKQLIIEKYTAQNSLDGSEFATVDNVLIREKKIKKETNSCLVKFHIRCSYQPAALPPAYQYQPNPLDTDATIELIYIKKEWKRNE